ncbi:dihydropteroate synthase [Sulfurimonas sp.]
MIIEHLSNTIDIKAYLKTLGVDSGGVNILAAKAKSHIVYIKDMHVGAANILKQDALSIGADLAVPRGTVIATKPKVDTLLIATTKQLQLLAKKELSQPFGLKELALHLKEFLKAKRAKNVDIMGVLNANDDSFYAQSRFSINNSIETIQKMIEDGANIIDIGAVSSRPGAPRVSLEDEYARMEPIVKIIKEEKLYEKVDFSCDSYEPKVLELALKNGFSIVNDITALENDEVCEIVAKYNAKVVLMHMQGTPQTMQKNPAYDNILTDVYSFLQERVQKAESFGIEEIILDVGIGFGKTLADNLTLVKNLEHFMSLNKPLLVGASRKSMINKISPSEVKDRLAGTITLHLEAVKNGAAMLRVHDVYAHTQALQVQKALDSFNAIA